MLYVRPEILKVRGSRFGYITDSQWGNTMTLALNIRQNQSRKSGIHNMAIGYSDQHQGCVKCRCSITYGTVLKGTLSPKTMHF